MDPRKLEELQRLLTEREIPFQTRRLNEYLTDASFLTRGVPPIAISLRTEEQALQVIDLLAKRSIPVAIRAMGSSTAGATLADEETVLLLVDRLGMTDRWGNRTLFFEIEFSRADGSQIPRAELKRLRGSPPLLRDMEVYARVPAGLSTDELDRYLSPYGLHTAIVPSSGWSSIAANFSTNAGGNGSPSYGTFKDIVRRVRMIGTALPAQAKIFTVTDRQKIASMAGHQGLLGIITDLDVRVVYDLPEEELLSAIVSYDQKDLSRIGEEVGIFMDEVQRECKMINAEFLLLDPLILDGSNPTFSDPELKNFFDLKPGYRRMLVLYQGERRHMERLPQIASSHPGIRYQEISAAGLKKMLEVRKAAAGKASGRVGIPGFEDIFVKDPKKLGMVLAKIFEMSEGILPGRPYGHQYIHGLVIHYRPLARLERGELERAWALTASLGEEIFGNPDYATEKRCEHGLGLELFALSPKERAEELLALKREFDPAMIFSPFLMDAEPKLQFAAQQLEGLKAPPSPGKA
ncbi:MAG: FAD-binding oxidoreductase [candidate division NC10 bacterium]|nr:FAD-binding oxidoreductase [candidate division NC10 bacterium]